MLWCFATWLVAWPAVAQPSSRVLIVHTTPTDAGVLKRLSAELAGLGFDVVRLAPDANATPASLDDLAREANAVAAVRLSPSERGVEVWIADRVTGKTLLRDVVVAQGSAAEEVVALQTVELLRASLLELQLPDSKRHAEVAPPPAASKLAKTPSSESGSGSTVEVGAAMLISPGGVAPAPVAAIGGRWDLGSMGLFVDVLLPTFPSTLRGSQGEAAISISAAVLGADLRLSDSDLESRIGAGLGVVHLRTTGSAITPFSGRTEGVTVIAPALETSLLYRIGGPFRVGVELLGGVALSRPVVSFADQQVASWGRPFASSALILALQVD